MRTELEVSCSLTLFLLIALNQKADKNDPYQTLRTSPLLKETQQCHKEDDISLHRHVVSESPLSLLPYKYDNRGF